MIDVCDHVIVVVKRENGSGHVIGVSMARGRLICMGQNTAAFTPDDGSGKTTFVPRDRIFKDSEGLMDAIGCARDLAEALGVEVM